MIAHERRGAVKFGVSALIAALVLGLIAGMSSPIVALALIGAPIAVWLMVRSPIGAVSVVLMLGVQLLDDPNENPGQGRYRTPLFAIGRLVFKSFDASLGLPGVKLFGIEAIFIALALLLVVTLVPLIATRRGRQRNAPPMVFASLLAAAALAVMFVYGVGVRGAPTRMALLQSRALLATILVPLLLSMIWQDRKFVRIILGGVVGVAVVRATIGLFFWATIVRHDITDSSGGSGAYVTTHSDSIIVAVAMIILVVWFFSRPSYRRGVALLAASPIFGAFLVVNNRRVAVVALVLGLFFIGLASRGRLKRRLLRIALFVIPLAAIYVGVAWNASGGWASPVRKLKSIVEQGDESSRSRDLENFNLVVTLDTAKVIGTGLGHEYIEEIQGPSLGEFTVYRVIPHNAVLGLLSYGGIIGFTCVWFFFMTVIFFSLRIMWMAKSETDRVLGMVVMGTTIAYLVMAWGDLGIQTWHNALLLIVIYALVGPAALRTGAWPRRNKRSRA